LSGAESGDGSIGSYLARQRRLRGVSVDELASLTRIPRRSLERLEAGAFDATPDGFVRGFVRTVAEALGLDPDDAVNRLLREPREDEALLAAKARYQRRKLALRLGLAVVALVLAVALGRLFVWMFAGVGESDAPVVYRHDALRGLEAPPEKGTGSR
jgi:cytoskeletal protein RodZ